VKSVVKNILFARVRSMKVALTAAFCREGVDGKTEKKTKGTESRS